MLLVSPIKDVDYHCSKAAEAKEVQQPEKQKEKNKLLFFRSTNLNQNQLLRKEEKKKYYLN
jgi:hypothetical protein